MTVYALYNQKGGVGKTASTVNLAYLAAEEGWRTLLWDLDPQGAAGFYFQVEAGSKNEAKKILTSDIELSLIAQPSGYENLDIIPSDLSARNADVLLNDKKNGKKRLKQAIASIKNDYDIIFIDSPPGLSILHDSIFYAADFVLIPNVPTTLSVRSYEIIVEYFKQNNINDFKIKSFFSMTDLRKTIHTEVLQQYAKNRYFLKNFVPVSSDIERMGHYLAPVPVFASKGQASKSYRNLWAEVKKLTLA